MTTLPFADPFLTIPTAPKYVIEKPVGSRPFTLIPNYCRFRYAAEPVKKRVEISPWGDRPTVEAGMRLGLGVAYSFEVALRLPKEQVFRSTKTVVMQWYQQRLRNPPLSLELVGAQWRLVRLWGDASTGNPNRQTIWTAPAVRGESCFLWAQMCFVPGPGGYIRWTWEGSEPRNFPGPNCYSSTTEGILPKIGIYKPGAADGTVPAGQVTLMDFAWWSIE